MFDIQSFMPHGHCFMWQPSILWTHVISDAIVALAYYSIPIALAIYVKKSQHNSPLFSAVIWLFVAFILLCGTTHIISIYTMWVPNYYLQGYAKAATAIVSIVTAAALWPLLPKALNIPTPQQLNAANTELADLNDTLEQRVESETSSARAKTDELLESNSRLESFNNITAGREQRMIELKQEINALCKQFGESPRYKVVSLG